MFEILNRLPDRLKRITTGTELIREIDGLRFIAIFTVLIQHLHERFVRNTVIQFATPVEDNVLAFVATRGFVGVYVFFIISGFILCLPFAAKRMAGATEMKLKNYYVRRLTRLEPPYIIWMSIMFVAFIFFKHQSFTEYLPHYFANLTYTHGLIYQGWSLINPATWTLEVEVQFYVLAPFMAWGFFSIKNKVVRRATMVAFIFVFMVVQQYFEFFRLPWYLTVLGYLHYFLTGFIITDIYLCDWKVRPRRNTIYDFVALAALVIVIMIWDWEFNFVDRLAEAVLFFVFFYAVFRGNYANRFVTNRWIMSIGGMCYTIYLLHLPLAEFLMILTRKLQITNYYEVNILVQALIFLPLVFVVSVISFLLFEKPFMNKDWPKVVLDLFKSKTRSTL
ncbi:acyltransferase family protein [Chryseolinea lacunae]|uniref:Acyltransferase n=1 Tax=Chryseolinea lacunae TaxID=2801331 RepID=A0ABS1KM14_9BACT|nr:acyltransferase [Chryseolinea lacunae]MBL0740374.1 acyltransferase [Chryseolinea lacunae]